MSSSRATPKTTSRNRGINRRNPEYERASDGFIGKFWTMLRAGFGTTNKVDESRLPAHTPIEAIRAVHAGSNRRKP